MYSFVFNFHFTTSGLRWYIIVTMQQLLTQDDIYSILRSDEQLMNILRSIASVFDSPWCVFGGQIRNRIWDVASGVLQPHASTDVDIGIFVPHDETIATAVAATLSSSFHHFDWDVENFGVSHIENHDEPYGNLEDGLRKQLITVMSVGATLNDNGELVLISPLGFNDLLSCVVRPTPVIIANPERIPLITKMIATKKWQEKWPNLQVVL